MNILKHFESFTNPNKNTIDGLSEIVGDYNSILTNDLEDKSFLAISTVVNKKLATEYLDFSKKLVRCQDAAGYSLLKDLFHVLNAREIYLTEIPSNAVQNTNKEIISTLINSSAYVDIRKKTTNDDMRSYATAVDIYRNIQQQFQQKIETNTNNNNQNIPSQDSLKNAVHSAAKEASEGIERAEKTTNTLSFGTKRSEILETAPLAEQIIHYQNLMKNTEIAKIIEEMGRIQKNYNIGESFNPATSAKTTKVIAGGEITKIIPEELMLLSEEYFDLELLIRIQEERAMILGSNPPPPKTGPIIFCIDESSSMEGIDNIQAKAITLAMMGIAAEQNRPYSVILFAEYVTKTFTIENTEDTSTISTALEIAQSFSGGGTSFTEPLITALNILETSPPFNTADIIFITDGVGGLNTEIVEKTNHIKQTTGLKIITIHILNGYNQNYEHPLKSISDKTIHADKLINAEQEIIEHIRKTPTPDKTTNKQT